MTREEFMKGWVFLTAQPWGKRYSGHDGAAIVQSELYYKKFAGVQAYVWQACCEYLAEGEQWPSINALNHTLQHNTPLARALPAPEVRYCTMQEAFVDAPELLARLTKLLPNGTR